MKIFEKIPKKHYKYAFIAFVQILLMLFLMASFSKKVSNLFPQDTKKWVVIATIIGIIICANYTIRVQNEYFDKQDQDDKN